MDLTCVICQDLYEDPVLAKDGFCYCRACIFQWTGRAESWRSPRSNEQCEGWPVLMRDVERACLAHQAKLARLRSLHPEASLGAALGLGREGRPVALPSDCARLLELLPGAEAYARLELAYRAGLLDRLSDEELLEACRRDRRCVRFPLLPGDVVEGLVSEAARRCRWGAGPKILARARRHFLWRASFTDAIEVPQERLEPLGLRRYAGLYLRAWGQGDGAFLTFEKSQPPRATLRVPLSSNRDRGSAEALLHTLLQPEEVQEITKFASETDEVLPCPSVLWESRRGRPPFPDSRGGETDEEDEASTPSFSCLATMQRALSFLPVDFRYRPHVLRTGLLPLHLLSVKGRVDDILLETLEGKDCSCRKRPCSPDSST